MTQDRTPRGAEPRIETANRTRARVRRGAFPMDISLGPDTALRYIRTHTTRDLEDKHNFNESRLMGWEPVKVEELPEMQPYATSSGTIEYGGQILCKNSVETVQDAVHDYENEALSQAQKTTRDYKSSGADGIKTEAQESSKTTVRVVRR